MKSSNFLKTIKSLLFILKTKHSKFLMLLLLSFMGKEMANAQNGVGINATGVDANASSILDVSSTTKGLLIPRMTAAQKNAIASPATGLTIYQTDIPRGYWYYDGTSWFQMGGLPNGSAAGNTIYWDGTRWVFTSANIYNNGGNVGIGTSNPGAKLDLTGSNISTGISAENILRINRPSNGATKQGPTADFALGSTDASSSSNSKLEIKLSPTSFGSTTNVMTLTNTSAGGNIGIGLGSNNPSARLDISSSGASLSGAAHSVLLKTNAGALGGTANNSLNVASFGFLAGSNNVALGIKAFRTANGTDVSTSAIGLSFDSDGTTGRNGGQIWLNQNGNVGIGTFNPFNKLDVEGSLAVGSSISGAFAAPTNGAFIQGNVGIGYISGTRTISYPLDVLGNSSGYIALFKNNTSGDGVKISLGGVHPLWTGSAYRTASFGGLDGVINSFNGVTSSLTNILTTGGGFDINTITSLASASGNLAAGTLCNLTNKIVTGLNTVFNPVVIPAITIPYRELSPYINILDAFTVDLGFTILRIPHIYIPAVSIGPWQITNAIDPIPTIPTANCGSLPTLTAPTMNFNNVTNTLSNENYFLQFTDIADRQLGGVRATSITDFRTDYLNPAYFINLMGSISFIDVGGTLLTFIGAFKDLGDAYNAIGVEYMSGNGDYAEWLERSNPLEMISAGDIVGVKSGKITKDLNGAEQIMAVSKNPIVLGNMPEKSKTYLGNNIAFMGQIPVKVMGPVSSGDYIIANGHIGGFGKAVHPKDMTVDNYKLAVGRSWETRMGDGPKMVNTVVGVHNNGFLDIMKGMQKKIDNNETRLEQIESAIKDFYPASYIPVKK